MSKRTPKKTIPKATRTAKKTKRQAGHSVATLEVDSQISLDTKETVGMKTDPGLSKVSLIGLRLGAALGLLVSRERNDVESVLFR